MSLTPVKQLLQRLGELLPPPLEISEEEWKQCDHRALLLYRVYLSSTVHFGSNQTTIAMLDNDVLSDLYGCDEQEPRFLTIFDKGGDLAKLTTILRINLAIYFSVQGESKMTKQGMYKFFDSRLHSSFENNHYENIDRKTYFFLLERGKKIMTDGHLQTISSWLAPYRCNARESESSFMSGIHTSATKNGNCFYKALQTLLNANDKRRYDWPPLDNACSTLSELCHFLNESVVVKRLKNETRKEASQHVIMAYHVATGLGKALRSVKSPKQQSYHILCSFNISYDRARDVGKEESDDRPTIICACFPDHLYIPTPPYAQKIALGCKLAESNKLDVKYLRGRGKRVRSNKSEQEEEEEEEEEEVRNREYDMEREEEDYAILCTCSICQRSQRIAHNFDTKHLMQRPYTVALDIPEYLKIFGIENEENLERFKTCCDISLAALDVESYTQTIPGAVSDEKVQVQTLTKLRYDSGIRKVQYPFLFAHLDKLDDDENREEGGRVKYFSITPENSLKQAVLEYLQYLRERKILAEEKKKALLAPLYAVLEPLKLAHLEYCREREDDSYDERQALDSFYCTLPGKFHRQLDRLVENFLVLTFNGESYDFPLLIAPMAGAVSQLKPPARLSFQRMGNKIRSITLTGKESRYTGLAFRDVCHLCDRSGSLARLAEMTDLTETKGLVPWGQITSLEDLNRPAFNWNRKEWVNDLTGEKPPQKDIDEARRIFEEKKMTSVLSYIHYYLEKDVRLLLQASTRLFQVFYNLLGSMIVDCRKTTIASLANFSVNLNNFRKKVPCMMSPTLPILYQLSKDASLGGLVQFSRAICDSEDEREEARLNKSFFSKNASPRNIDIIPEDDETNPLHFSPERELPSYLKVLNPLIDEIIKKHSPLQDRRALLPHMRAASVASQPELSGYNALFAGYQASKDNRVLPENLPLLSPAQLASEGLVSRHLLTEEERRLGPERGRYVLGYDVNSLYSSAFKYHIIFQFSIFPSVPPVFPV